MELLTYFTFQSDFLVEGTYLLSFLELQLAYVTFSVNGNEWKSGAKKWQQGSGKAAISQTRETAVWCLPTILLVSTD